jgi:hypothetical protein
MKIEEKLRQEEIKKQQVIMLNMLQDAFYTGAHAYSVMIGIANTPEKLEELIEKSYVEYIRKTLQIDLTQADGKTNSKQNDSRKIEVKTKIP